MKEILMYLGSGVLFGMGAVFGMAVVICVLPIAKIKNETKKYNDALLACLNEKVEAIWAVEKAIKESKTP